HPSDRGHPLDGDQPGAVRVHTFEPAGRGDRTEPPRRGTLFVSGTRIITGEAGRWTFPTTALNGVWHGRHGRAPRQGRSPRPARPCPPPWRCAPGTAASC